MKYSGIRFNDPEDLNHPSSALISLFMNFEMLDFARRHFERKGDKLSLKRAEEIRKFCRLAHEQYVYLVRAIVTEDVVHEYSKRVVDRIEKGKHADKE